MHNYTVCRRRVQTVKLSGCRHERMNSTGSCSKNKIQNQKTRNYGRGTKTVGNYTGKLEARMTRNREEAHSTWEWHDTTKGKVKHRT